MKRLAGLWMVVAIFLTGNCLAASIVFPPLSGRVVDAAHILSQQATDRLSADLAAQEAKTGQQVVVATVPSLQDQTIEDYGYQLGRAWGIGQKDKNTGAILLVAPAEHKVRIEVGYGLEGTLTDAKSSDIIHQVILPDFKAGNMEQGVTEGTAALLRVLNGQPVLADGTVPPVNGAEQETDPQPLGHHGGSFLLGNGVFLFLIIAFLMMRRSGGGSGLWLPLGLLSSQSWGTRGSSSGDSFSGGGGSFGGGGASGSW